MEHVNAAQYYAASESPSTTAAADPITAAIGLLRPRVVASSGVQTVGPWAARFAPFPHVRMGVVARGEIWLTVDGDEPVRLRAGDFYLLADAPAYTMGTSLELPPRSIEAIRAAALEDAGRRAQEEPDGTYLCEVDFLIEDRNASVLLNVLPTMVIVRSDDPRGELLAHLGSLIVGEFGGSRVGGSFVLEHLAQVLFVHMLRAHAEQSARPSGWLNALSDDGVGAALRAMHADVSRRWTLQELAAVSRMSRSSFAAAFKKQVGAAPMDYLIQWRMNLARDALCRNTRSISELALETGYESESAFSTAFRRVVGFSPKHFREAARGENGALVATTSRGNG
jgi:AraC-like DNA-binding protein